MSEITQADRDAAASGYFAWCSGNPVIPDRMKAGNADDHSMVQAFARHRMEERAAIVAWLHKQAALALAHDMELFKGFDQAKLEFAVTVTEDHAAAIEAGDHLK